jgi:hypothetical protein
VGVKAADNLDCQRTCGFEEAHWRFHHFNARGCKAEKSRHGALLLISWNKKPEAKMTLIPDGERPARPLVTKDQAEHTPRSPHFMVSAAAAERQGANETAAAINIQSTAKTKGERFVRIFLCGTIVTRNVDSWIHWLWQVSVHDRRVDHRKKLAGRNWWMDLAVGDGQLDLLKLRGSVVEHELLNLDIVVVVDEPLLP